VLALSWSPFLLVCAITVLVFVLLASVTFALMKYVDFSATFQRAGSRSSSWSQARPYAACKSTGGGGGGSGTSSDSGARSEARVASGQQEVEETADSRGPSGGCRGQRARVITLATANNGAMSEAGKCPQL